MSAGLLAMRDARARRFARAWADGVAVVDLRERYGLSSSGVYKLAAKLGIESRRRAVSPGRRPPDQVRGLGKRALRAPPGETCGAPVGAPRHGAAT